MDLKTYQEAAVVTINRLGTDTLDLAHMALGMSSEYGELVTCLKGNSLKIVDRVNLLEEIGDSMWYIANWCTIRNIDITALAVPDVFITDPMGNIITCIEWFTDSAKRELAYNQPINVQKRQGDERNMLILYMQALRTLAVDNGLTIPNVLAKNILKLYDRYKGKFSEHGALVRNLEAERKTLEA